MAKTRNSTSSARRTAGSRKHRYGAAASRTVARALHQQKRGQLKSGPKGKGSTVRSRKQAIAIGLSDARRKGAKVPARRRTSGDSQ